jgi:hypothetical protein
MSKKIPGDLSLDDSDYKPAGDRKKFGWPAEEDLPFANAAYYEQFDKKYRPRVGAGGAVSFNLSMQELQRVNETYQRKFPMMTYINMTLQDHHMTVVGATPGSLVEVIVPPFGVFRGSPEDLDKIAMNGSSYKTFYPIAPEGDCEGKQTVKDKGEGVVFETCKFTNCPRHPSNGLVHSVQHALHFIGAIGDGLRNPMNTKIVDGEPPDEDFAQKMIQLKYLPTDPRPAVILFANQRMKFLMERKAKRELLLTDANARLAASLAQS